ncbi:hypothetical protein PC116_g29649 [Phytophthora cactorum]|nr:hypothetical protein PC116_g29649 [Phytophthora cactorum]
MVKARKQIWDLTKLVEWLEKSSWDRMDAVEDFGRIEEEEGVEEEVKQEVQEAEVKEDYALKEDIKKDDVPTAAHAKEIRPLF